MVEMFPDPQFFVVILMEVKHSYKFLQSEFKAACLNSTSHLRWSPNVQQPGSDIVMLSDLVHVGLAAHNSHWGAACVGL